MKIKIINGPNLNMLQYREVSHYPQMSLTEIKQLTETIVLNKQLELVWEQSNNEAEIVEFIQASISDKTEALIINPGAYSHTSIAITDALKLLIIPKIEVHLSHIHHREDYRRQLLTSQAVDTIMCGLGEITYAVAIEAICLLNRNK
jgi:3-dehydroquinate dehydratase-2